MTGPFIGHLYINYTAKVHTSVGCDDFYNLCKMYYILYNYYSQK